MAVVIALVTTSHFPSRSPKVYKRAYRKGGADPLTKREDQGKGKAKEGAKATGKGRGGNGPDAIEGEEEEAEMECDPMAWR